MATRLAADGTGRGDPGKTSTRCSIPVLGIVFLTFVLLTQDVLAQVVFNVNDIGDGVDADVTDGKCQTPPPASSCTLRAAIMQANRIPAAGAKIMLPAGNYQLTIPASVANGEENGDLNVYVPNGYAPGPTSIVGAGAAFTSIDAMGQSRVLNVARTLSISGVTMTNGHVTSDSGGGIVVLVAGQLTLADCTVSNSIATYSAVGGRGGGISNNGASSLTRVLIVANRASIGGGIHNFGSLAIAQSVLAGNIGDGLFNESGTAAVASSTFSGNSSSQGGAIRNVANLIVTNSTLAQNSATDNGGAIDNGGTANIYNTTIAYNEADSDASGSGDGAGISNYAGKTFNLRNSVIALNYLAGQQNYADCFGTFAFYGNSKVSPETGCASAGGDGTVSNLDSVYELGILAENGGPTKTIAPIASSSLINGAIGCSDINGIALTSDQRGKPRPLGGTRCDIGALEYNELFRNGFES